jgi:hypothetical protein
LPFFKDFWVVIMTETAAFVTVFGLKLSQIRHGTLAEGEGSVTVDLLIKVACYVSKRRSTVLILPFIKSSLNKFSHERFKARTAAIVADF